MGILTGEATLSTNSTLFSRSQLLQERICSSRNILFLLRVDPMSRSYIIDEANKISCINKAVFRRRQRGGGVGGGAFIRVGAFIRFNGVLVVKVTLNPGQLFLIWQ